MSEWYPIETAPKDGRKILVSNGVEVDTSYWDCDAWCALYSERLPYEPTHWKHRPNPPEESK